MLIKDPQRPLTAVRRDKIKCKPEDRKDRNTYNIQTLRTKKKKILKSIYRQTHKIKEKIHNFQQHRSRLGNAVPLFEVFFFLSFFFGQNIIL